MRNQTMGPEYLERMLGRSIGGDRFGKDKTNKPNKFDWKNLTNAGIGLGESWYGQNLYEDQIADIKGDWRDQIAADRPGNVGGIYGSTLYNPDTNTLGFTPNTPSQGMLASLYNQQTGYADQLANFNKDPMALGEYMYGLKSPIREKEQATQTNQLLERLQAQGMLSSSHGGQLQGGLAQAQNLANAQALSEDIMNAQNIANAIQGRQTSSMAGIDAINTALNNQAQTAINMGVNIDPPSSLGSAYQDQVDAKAQTGGSLADILGIVANPIGGFIKGLFS